LQVNTTKKNNGNKRRKLRYTNVLVERICLPLFNKHHQITFAVQMNAYAG